MQGTGSGPLSLMPLLADTDLPPVEGNADQLIQVLVNLLSVREFSVLLKNEGKILSAEEIYQGAWNQPMAGNASAL